MTQLNPFRPLRTQRSSEKVAEAIRETIVSGVFSPGDRLPPERSLAERFGVTRNTVREALRRLEQYRLVSIRQGSGVTVQDYLSHAGIEFLSSLVTSDAAPTRAIVDDLLEARAVLGEAILLHAIDHAAPERLGAYADAVDALAAEVAEPSGRPRALLDLDFDVHRALVRAGGNQAFVLFLNTMRSIYEPVAHMFAPVVENPNALVQRYRETLALIESGDREQAKDIYRKLFAAGRPSALRKRGGRK